MMKYPHAARAAGGAGLRDGADRWSRSAPSSTHLKTVEIPANSKAHAGRARDGRPSRELRVQGRARARRVSLRARRRAGLGDLARAGARIPTQVDTSIVRVGTKVALANGDDRREVTILGPWESAPEHGVYSNQSDVAKALIGHATGDLVTFMGNDYQIESIRKWAE